MTIKSNVLSAVLIVCIIILALAYWQQRSRVQRITKENEQLQHRHQALQQPSSHDTEPQEPSLSEPADVSPPSTSATEQPSKPTPPEAPKPIEKEIADLVPTPHGFAPNPRSTGLALAGTHGAPIENGYQTTMQFNPTTTEPLGIVSVVVRLPKNDGSRILDLAPAGSAQFNKISKRVSEDGKFAVFEGTLENVSSIEFALSVSGETVADVRGTCGIGPYDLTIGPNGASAQPK